MKTEVEKTPYSVTKKRIRLLQFLVGPGFFLGRVVLAIDNVMLLVLNTSYGYFDPRNLIVFVVGLVIAAIYFAEVFAAIFALRKYVCRSPAHFLDLLVILAKVITVGHLWFFFSNAGVTTIDYPLLVGYTGLRTFFRSSAKAYHLKVLRLFANEGLDVQGVRASLRALPIEGEQIQKLEDLLDQCTEAKDERIEADELHRYLLLVGDCMPAEIASRVSAALSTVTVAVQVLECKNVLMRGALYCTGTIRNADGRPLPCLADKAKMQMSYKKSKASILPPGVSNPQWNDILLFEGLPRESDRIRIDVGEGEHTTKGSYRVHVPMKGLRKGVVLDKWFVMDVRGHKKGESAPGVQQKAKLPKIHLKIRIVLSSFGSEPKAISMDGKEVELEDQQNFEVFTSTTNPPYGILAVIASTLRHWSQEWKILIPAVLVFVLHSAVVPASAFVSEWLINSVLKSTVRNDEVRDEMLYLLGAYAGLALFGVVTGFVLGTIQAYLLSQVLMELRRTVLDVVLSAGTHFHDTNSEGELSALFASNVSRVNALWQSFYWSCVGPIFAIVFALGYLFSLSPNSAVMGFAFLIIVFSGGPEATAADRSRTFIRTSSANTAEYCNAVHCQKAIRAYNIQPLIMARFHGSLQALVKAEFSNLLWGNNMQKYVESLLTFFITLQTVAMALQTYLGNLNLGQFVAIAGLYMSIIRPASQLGSFSRVALTNGGSLQRLDDVLKVKVNTNVSVFKRNFRGRLARLHTASGDAAISMMTARNAPRQDYVQQRETDIITFSHVYFKYQEDTVVLEDLCASIPRGSYCCLCGPSGSGKSTLLSILLGFYRHTQGSIIVDRLDVEENAEEINKKVAVVFQNALIFNGTILDNIRYGQWEASRLDCERAAQNARCEFLSTLEHGLDTVLGSNGVNLSGGQLQRICLARGLVRNPKILLLDEVTSALDAENEASIVETFENLAKTLGMTILSVTHRLKTTVNADQILVLSKGRIAESGKYAELMQKKGLFARMVGAQERGPVQLMDEAEEKNAALQQLLFGGV